jgi:hypothetical protein
VIFGPNIFLVEKVEEKEEENQDDGGRIFLDKLFSLLPRTRPTYYYFNAQHQFYLVTISPVLLYLPVLLVSLEKASGSHRKGFAFRHCKP